MRRHFKCTYQVYDGRIEKGDKVKFNKSVHDHEARNI